MWWYTEPKAKGEVQETGEGMILLKPALIGQSTMLNINTKGETLNITSNINQNYVSTNYQNKRDHPCMLYFLQITHYHNMPCMASINEI